MPDIAELLRHLRETGTSGFALLSQETSPVADILAAEFPRGLNRLFSAEHGFFGFAAPGEKTPSASHPRLGLPIHSLYGEHRKPSPEMLAGLDRIVVDLQDLGVRCYTFLATLKLVLEAAAENSIAVTILDRPIPLGGIVDGPGREAQFESFVAPLDVPLCHGMTPAECAVFIRSESNLDIDLSVVRAANWNHSLRTPWRNFMPPSPGIPSWDSAALYPATLFTEAYPAVDCDRSGPLSFRVIGAPWMNAADVLDDVSQAVASCGLGIRPYRYRPRAGRYADSCLDGIALSVVNPDAFYPVSAGIILFSALWRRYPNEMSTDARAHWLDKLFGSSESRTAAETGALGPLFGNWLEAQDSYLSLKVNLY